MSDLKYAGLSGERSKQNSKGRGNSEDIDRLDIVTYTS